MKLYRYLDTHRIEYHAVKWANGYRLEAVMFIRKGDFIEGDFEDTVEPYAHLKMADGWTLYEMDKSVFELVINS
jgi:hypothetical protein